MKVNNKLSFKLMELEEVSDGLDEFLDSSYSILKREHPSSFLHRWMIYNDRRLNLLIEIVKILIEGGNKND